MFRNLLVISVIVLCSGTSSALAEAGPCQEKGLRQKVACLNKRLADLEAKVMQLPTRGDLDNVSKSAAGVATSAVFDKLKAVKIEWADRPGVCLFFNDWTTKPERTAYTVEGCRGPAQSGFNLSIVTR